MAVDLYWIPLGAGGHSVRFNGRVFEAIEAARAAPAALRPLPRGARRRARTASATRSRSRPRRTRDEASRGVVATGAVGSRYAAPAAPVSLRGPLLARRVDPGSRLGASAGPAGSRRPAVARRLLDAGRGRAHAGLGPRRAGAGEMWNSNSMIAWSLSAAGLPTAAIRAPAGGRAPGWDAGLVVARRPVRGVCPRRARGRLHRGAARARGRGRGRAVTRASSPARPTALDRRAPDRQDRRRGRHRLGAGVEVLSLPQSFLAPWAALLTVHATVYRTLARGLQQAAAAVVGVLLAFAVGAATRRRLAVARARRPRRPDRRDAPGRCAPSRRRRRPPRWSCSSRATPTTGACCSPGCPTRSSASPSGSSSTSRVAAAARPPGRAADRRSRRPASGRCSASSRTSSASTGRRAGPGALGRAHARARPRDRRGVGRRRSARESGRLNFRREAPRRVRDARDLGDVLLGIEQAVAETRSMVRTMGRAGAPARLAGAVPRGVAAGARPRGPGRAGRGRAGAAPRRRPSWSGSRTTLSRASTGRARRGRRRARSSSTSTTSSRR